MKESNRDQRYREDRAPAQTHQARLARLQSLLFTGAALGTTLLLLGNTTDPKIPPFVGE